MRLQASLEGQTALVTGAGRRLGRAFALALARAGADVCVHYNHSLEAANETASQIKEMGRRASALQADLANLEQTSSLVERAQTELGTVQLLVNNASIFGPAGAAETTPEDWQRHLDINLRAPVLLTQSLAGRLSEESGSVVNLLDWRALRPGLEHFAYTISKAGLAAATRSLARAYAPRLRVNGLALGAILPPAGGEGGAEDDIIAPVPADRWGTVEEAVEALMFLLAGPDYITGEVLHLDGGRHLV